MSKKQKIYTTEFKAEAIKAIEENRGNVSETARQIGISMQTLSNRYKKAKFGTLAGTQEYLPDLVALLEENKKLKQQLKTAEMEKEFRWFFKKYAEKNKLNFDKIRKYKSPYKSNVQPA